MSNNLQHNVMFFILLTYISKTISAIWDWSLSLMKKKLNLYINQNMVKFPSKEVQGSVEIVSRIIKLKSNDIF